VQDIPVSVGARVEVADEGDPGARHRVGEGLRRMRARRRRDALGVEKVKGEGDLDAVGGATVGEVVEPGGEFMVCAGLDDPTSVPAVPRTRS
jgi:hypothetical protein